MKDLRFYSDGTEIGRHRVDSISGVGNLTVMETYGLDDRSPDMGSEEDEDYQKKVGLATEFKKIPHTFSDFIDFASDNDLMLTSEDSNGSNKIVLIGGVEITTDNLDPAIEGEVYNETIESSGGIGDISFKLDSGSLPTGISVAASGVVSGTPTEIGTFEFTVMATDEFGFSTVKNFVLVVDSAG